MAIVFLFVQSTVFAGDKVLTLKSDPWCPFNCEDKDKDLGFVVDMTKSILEKKGYKINYKNINYARAIQETRNGETDGIVGCAKEDAPDFVFPEEAQAETSFEYFTLKDSTFKYGGLASLKGKKIGVINSYTYDPETNDEIQKKNPSFVIVSGDEGLAQLLKMLDAKRIDALVESGDVLNSYLQKNIIGMKKYKVAGIPKQVPQKIYVCFSPKIKNAKELAHDISEGTKALKKSGEYAKLLKKYLKGE